MTTLSAEELALFGGDVEDTSFNYGANVIPPDAPKNDPDIPPPGKAKPKKMKVVDESTQTATPAPKTATVTAQVVLSPTQDLIRAVESIKPLDPSSQLAKRIAKALRAAAAALEE
jgi:hypothetical protein